MPAPKKHPIARKLQYFGCFAVLNEEIFAQDKAKTAGMLAHSEDFQRRLDGNMPFKTVLSWALAGLAPHLLFTQFLDDSNEAERNLGIDCGLELLKSCDELWYFGDKVTSGMVN